MTIGMGKELLMFILMLFYFLLIFLYCCAISLFFRKEKEVEEGRIDDYGYKRNL